LEEIFSRRIDSPKAKFSFKNAFSLFSLLLILLAIVGIWGRYPFVSISLIIAAFAIALQDFFRNFVGGIIIFASGIYRVGDRIEVQEKCGDVIKIGIFYTTLMELKEWISGEQETGRLTTLPNSHVISNHINNYTKDHPFIWDELTILITQQSQWKEAIKQIESIVETETKNLIDDAKKEITKMGEKYYIRPQTLHPTVYTSLKENQIQIRVRYLTRAKERRNMKNRLRQIIFSTLEKSKKITLIST
jgi:small-conductance mechanosensitive channel